MENTESELERVKRLLTRKKQECEKLEEELDNVRYDLSKLNKEWEKDKLNHDDLAKDKEQLENSYEILNQRFQQEKAMTQLRENLVGALLSAKNENAYLAQFENVLYNEFLPFAAEESSLQNEAGALLKLQEIERELTMISGFPAFHSAHTIAVGGGFSAGKSEFISSFFNDKGIKLPSSIEPTTAIATYVVNQKNSTAEHETNSLTGINIHGAAVDLLKIDPDLVQKLNHQFMRSFNFPLKSIMPYMFLSTGLKYDQICFVDTPGYNPTGAATSEDVTVAREFVSNADALIWLVGADSNGTIPRTDIAFLKNILTNNPKPVYFVLNKADLKPKADIVKIIAEFSRVLDHEKISYAGISAYSSIEGKELDYWRVKKSLYDFLLSMNISSNKQDEILKKLYSVERAYQLAIKKDIKMRKEIIYAVDDIGIALNMANFKRGSHKVYDQIDELASLFNYKEKEKQLKQLENLMTNFTNIINELFGHVSTLKRPNIIQITEEGYIDPSEMTYSEIAMEEVKTIAKNVGEKLSEHAASFSKEFGEQAKVISKEMAEQAKIFSKEMAQQAKEKGREISKLLRKKFENYLQ